MKAIHMKYRPKVSLKKRQSELRNIQCSPFITLSKVNTFSSRPVPKDCEKAIAYSKGRLVDLSAMPWDD